MLKECKNSDLIRDVDIQIYIVYWSKYVTVLITYMDNSFSNHPAFKKVPEEAMYLLYFRLFLVTCIKGNPCS